MPNWKKSTTLDWITIKGKSSRTKTSLYVNRQDIYVQNIKFKGWMQKTVLKQKQNLSVQRSDIRGHIWQ